MGITNAMQQVYRMFFGWLPAPHQSMMLALFGLVVLILAFRLIKIILDALPFV